MCLSLLVFTQLLFSKVARSQPAKPARKQNLTRNSHSRSLGSCILGSLKSRRRTACCHIITLASSLKYPKKTENAENCRSRLPHCRLTPPPQETPANIRQKVQSLGYILLLIVWVYRHSNFCGGLRKTHLFCDSVHIGRSRSSKVVDFGTNRKDVCHFLLVINSNFGPILHRF